MKEKSKTPISTSGKTTDHKASQAKAPKHELTLVFEKQNYILMIVGVVLIFLGYILMIGGGSKDPAVFSEDIFNFQRLTLSPILLVAGFIVEIFAIMKKPKEATTETN